MKDNIQIIVYGGTGFYGQKVVEKLIQKGQSVKVVTRNSENAKEIGFYLSPCPNIFLLQYRMFWI